MIRAKLSNIEMRANETFLSFHRNPVTGSVANYSSSGASADIEESEPLGQTVETSDPGSGYPTSYEDIRGIARDPEWQCRVAGIRGTFFNEMPVHCKKAKLAEHDFNLPGALAESDPKRVVRVLPSESQNQDKKKRRKGRGQKPVLRPGPAKPKGVPAPEVREEDLEQPIANVDPPDFSKDFWSELGRGFMLAELVARRVRFIGFSDEQEAELTAAIWYMVMSQSCVDAFRLAALPTPAEVIRDRGRLFIHLKALAPPLSKELKELGFSDERRAAYRVHAARTAGAKGGGSTPFPNAPLNAALPVTTILWDASFDGRANFEFEETIVHEDVHGSGVPQVWELGQWFFPYGHDLTGFGSYAGILSHCRRR